jgi:hypothetical protein
MRLVLIILLIAAAAWIFVLGFRNQKRISYFGIIVVLIPAGALSYFEYNWQIAQDNISAVVQSITKSPDTSFECQRISFGFFDAEAGEKALTDNKNLVKLKYSSCAALLKWYGLDEKNKPTEEQIAAIHLFSSETMRVAGQSDTAMQECLAVKNDSAIVQKLGGSKKLGDYISLYYQQNIADQTPQVKVYC